MGSEMCIRDRANSAKTLLRLLQTKVKLKSVMEIGGFLAFFWHSLILKSLFYTANPVFLYMNGKVLMLAIIFWGGFHVFYAFNRVQNFDNIMYRLCAIQLGECLRNTKLPHKRCPNKGRIIMARCRMFPFITLLSSAVLGSSV